MLGLSEFTPTLEMDDKEVFKESFKESFKGSFKESLCANPPISPNDFKIIWPATLSKKSSAIILQLESLIGQTVERIGESGNPGGFNAATWMVDWINSPNQTLVGKRPAQYLNTLRGHKIVSDILAKAQLGS